eukprot:259004_1
MSSFDNNEEDRGYIDTFNVGDVFLTCWECTWLIPITFVYYFLIKSSSGYRGKTWLIGFISCTFMYIRHLSSISSWISWLLTFDYGSSSVSYISQCGLYTFSMLSYSFLYLFFIYRLYKVYDPNLQMDLFKISSNWYQVHHNLLYKNDHHCHY